MKADPDRPPPPIFITSADNSQQQQQQQQQPNFYLNINDQPPSTPNSPLSTASSPRLNNVPSNNHTNNPQLSVQTQNLQQHQQQQQLAIHQFPPQQHQRSPSLTPTYQQAVNTPLPPSPCPSPGQFLDDDGSNQSMYHPRSPMLGPNAYMMDAQQQQQQQQQHHHQQQQQHYNNNSF